MKNDFIELDNNTIIIYIRYKDKTLECYIDKEDLDKVSFIKGTWHITNNRRNHLDGVRTKIQKGKVRKQYWMHNLIMKKTNPNNVIDHIDNNPLNNRKSNLREITLKENASNISVELSKSKTRVRNVTIERGKYRVRINGKSFGSYATLELCKVSPSMVRFLHSLRILQNDNLVYHWYHNVCASDLYSEAHSFCRVSGR